MRRGIVAFLVVGLVVGGVAGWVLFSGAAPERASAEGDQAVVVKTADDGWRQLSYHALTVAVPGGWVRLSTEGCDVQGERWGPDGVDPCTDGPGLWFFASATFDPADGPGVHTLAVSEDWPTGGWAGYVDRSPDVVYAQDTSQDVVQQVLRSVAD